MMPSTSTMPTFTKRQIAASHIGAASAAVLILGVFMREPDRSGKWERAVGRAPGLYSQ